MACLCALIDTRKPNHKKGYFQISIFNRPFLAHRLAWMYMTGSMPDSKHEIDHINGNRNDNRWCNLRLATDGQNMFNAKLRKDNSSGYKGVLWSTQKSKWYGIVCYNRKQHYSGFFHSKEEAFAARNELAKKLHGEFHNDGLTGLNR
jgi:hypothetical protein